jgi:uncharacterized protein
MSAPESFSLTSVDPAVRGFLHRPASPASTALILTHGAGGNSRGALLSALGEAFSEAGIAFLRCDLPFRQSRPSGPPRPGDAARDREGLRRALEAMRQLVSGRVFLGGQSYGGRQASMLCSEHSGTADGLLLLSYPLHPPGKPLQLRTQHLPGLHLPVLFVQGTRDPFATIEELRSAIGMVPARTELVPVENAGHDLGFTARTRGSDLPRRLVREFQEFFG